MWGGGQITGQSTKKGGVCRCFLWAPHRLFLLMMLTQKVSLLFVRSHRAQARNPRFSSAVESKVVLSAVKPHLPHTCACTYAHTGTYARMCKEFGGTQPEMSPPLWKKRLCKRGINAAETEDSCTQINWGFWIFNCSGPNYGHQTVLLNTLTALSPHCSFPPASPVWLWTRPQSGCIFPCH